jgi:hypothetical protein
LYKVTNPIDDDVTLYILSPCYMWSYSVWISYKGWKVENCYGWEDCINWEKWHMKIGF